MPPKETPDKREELARDYADTIPDDDGDENNDYEPTYRDGSMKNECWDDRGYRDNSDWRDDR